MTDLVRYEAARRALAEAHRVDEVKDIRDKAVAMQEYAKQAKDTQLLQHATEIRLRAERRAGELLAEAEGSGAESTGSNQHRCGRRSQPHLRHPTLADLGITKTQSAKWQKLAALPEDKFEIRVEHAKARVEGMTTSAPRLFESGIYRRERMVHASGIHREGARDSREDRSGPRVARPCPEDSARRRVLHRRRGRAHQPWSGRVWLNPPYSRELMSPFVDKFLSEYARGAIEQAILLTHDYTDTGWFHAAARAAQAICLVRARIHFLAPSGEECSPRRGQTFFYFGLDDGAFRRAFSDIGLIMRPA